MLNEEFEDPKRNIGYGKIWKLKTQAFLSANQFQMKLQNKT